ncbi:MAG: creatininase family protein [Bauldia sp.]|nr:creatininase family protein [Bauldia sp.]
MSAADVAAGDAASWLAVIPVAAVEQHGAHLPLATDAAIGAGLLAQALAAMPPELPVTALPMVTVGSSGEHAGFAGTLSLEPDTLRRVLAEIGFSVVSAGVRRVLFINSHGGNSPVLDLAIQTLRERHPVLAAATSWGRFGMPEGLVDADELAFGIHGGLVETALMLHFRPELVRMEKATNAASLQAELARDFTHLRAYGAVRFGWKAADLNPAGVVGDAPRATAAIGAAIAAHQAAGFVTLCREMLAFDPGRLAE